MTDPKDVQGGDPDMPDERVGGTRRQAQVFHQSAGAVVLSEGRCLAVHLRAVDEWGFPKGHLEEGEQAADAAVREVLEETGYDIRILGPIGNTRYAFGESQEHRKRVDWFLAELIGGTLTLDSPFSEIEFLDEATAQVRLTHANDREIAQRAFDLANELGR